MKNGGLDMVIRVGLLLVIGLVAIPAALACGPYYGSGLLADRQKALLRLEDGSFAAEAPKLVTPPHGLPRESQTIGREALDERWLSARQRALVERLSEMESAEQAYSQGESLPEATRAYSAGAVAWYAANLSEAKRWFGRAAEQPPAENDPWPLMGEYMLARTNKRLLVQSLEARDIDDDAAESKRLALADEALTGFERVRARVRAGEVDPLGLSIGSLGEQAGVHEELGQLQEQMMLYAQQAALGSQAGRQSLLFLARWIRIHPELLDEALQSALGLDLMVLFAYTHFPAQVGPESNETWNAYGNFGRRPPRSQRLETINVLEKILGRLDALPSERWPATDRLAALLYRQGHYEWAERAVSGADSPLADWVRAKLALRDDRVEQASDYFEAAMRGFEGVEWKRDDYYGTERKPSCMIAAEAGLLALSRDELTTGFELMLMAGPANWLDAAYLAEYVLTLDELRTVIGRLPYNEDLVDSDQYFNYRSNWPFYGSPSRDVYTAARYLFARTLMRASLFDEAIDYFPWQVTRDHARRFAAQMTAPEDESDEMKARRLFEAARMARDYGLRLLGWETEPDYAVYGANHHLNSGVGEVLDSFDDPAQRRWMAEREVQGVLEGRIRPGRRYSYRYTAAALANRAADFLQPESEDFAIALCHAARWLTYIDHGAAKQYFQRYQGEGQVFSWHARFGQECPDPSWNAATELDRTLGSSRFHSMRRYGQ